MPIEIRPVHTHRERRQFLTFPYRVFRGDPMWVPPVLSELAARIDPQRGEWFTQGTAELYVARRDGKLVGTICCAHDRARDAHHQTQDAIFGFNHYIPDYAVAKALWDHAAEWARVRGLNALRGPFDLNYEDGYGILIQGYDRPPALFCGHTPPYYREFVERYGFEPGREQNIALEISVAQYRNLEGPTAKLHRVARSVRKRARVTVRSANLDDWDNEIDRVIELLNQSLRVLPHHTPWRPETLEAMARGLRRFIDPDLVLFGQVDGQVVGLLLALPNLNEALIRANGLRYPWDKLRAWWALRRRPECLCVKSLVVLPEYWGRGVDALMYYEMGQRAVAKGYRWADLSITGAENPMTPRLGANLGARIYKRWQIYRIDVQPARSSGAKPGASTWPAKG